MYPASFPNTPAREPYHASPRQEDEDIVVETPQCASSEADPINVDRQAPPDGGERGLLIAWDIPELSELTQLLDRLFMQNPVTIIAFSLVFYRR